MTDTSRDLDEQALDELSLEERSIETSALEEPATVRPAPGNELPTQDQLEVEGDVAADYIEELLDIADLDGDIDITVRAGRAYVSVTASGDANVRVLSKPDTVAALQELTRIAVQTKTGNFSRLILDVGGSRDARAAELAVLVERAVGRIEEGATSAALPPMSSYERKLVHDIVAERGFVSESEGEGADRHTVIRRA
ncbi:MAG: DNA-binding protein [Amnibacterium sp.]|nr:DNA-binding protein [Amnibacterium sp.]